MGFTKADIVLLDSAFATVHDARVPDLARMYNYKMHYYSGTILKYDSALLYADSCIALLQDYKGDDKDEDLYISTHCRKGDISLKIKNYDEAIHNYVIGKVIMEAALKDPCAINMYYNSMANILYEQKKYLQAVQFFRMKYLVAPVCIADSFLSYSEVQGNLDNMGMCYAKAGLTDSANFYYKAALECIDKNEKRFPATKAAIIKMHRAVVYYNQAEILRQQKDTVGAEKLFFKSIEGSKSSGDIGFIKNLRLSLAGFYLEAQQPEKAGAVLLDAATQTDDTEISQMADNYYKLLTDYYIQTKQFALAHHSLQRSHSISDSIERRDRQFNATDVRREFENREQMAINQTLKKDNETKTWFLLLALIGGVMAIIIILLVWFNLKRKSGYVKKLTSLNEKVNQKNDDLQNTLSSLEQSHAENSRIMRVVAHDLKNPISAIRTLSYSLRKKESEPAKQETLELIQATCTDSVTLINDLLHNKPQASLRKKELVDIGRLVEQCAELFQIKADDKNLQLTMHVAHAVVMINRQRIWRVVSNIINNAIKFSPPYAEIIIGLESKSSYILFSVIDKGIGIPDSFKDKLFMNDPGTSREGTEGEESYGMGLSISRKIIEEHAGKLWFESKPGKGSVFYVELPYSTAS